MPQIILAKGLSEENVHESPRVIGIWSMLCTWLYRYNEFYYMLTQQVETVQLLIQHVIYPKTLNPK